MFNRRKCILGLVLGLVAIIAATDTAEEITTVNAPPPEPPLPSSSSTSKPTSKPPTTKPTTKPTIPPTTSPTTSTTTVAPNTTIPTTTTPKPTEPTTVSPITTTATPPKPIPPEEGDWNVTSSGNKSCILLHMMAVVDVYYVANNVTKIDQYSVPKGANASGNCGEKEQRIKLSWPFNKTVMDSVEFVFKKNDTKFDLEIVLLNVTVDDHNNNSTMLLHVNHTKEEFTTPIKMSYKCKKGQLLNFTNPETNETIASLHISNVQFQAFGNITEHNFDTAKDCEPYETPDIVPIAVGCALIALIVFVLIGYLIGRRRNQARGYLSM